MKIKIRKRIKSKSRSGLRRLHVVGTVAESKFATGDRCMELPRQYHGRGRNGLANVYKARAMPAVTVMPNKIKVSQMPAGAVSGDRGG
jgi:hypothetical protein